MTPFQEFRLWARRASGADRGLALLAVTVVLALTAWALVPAGGGSSSDVASVNAGGPQTGSGSPGAVATGSAAVAASPDAGPSAPGVPVASAPVAGATGAATVVEGSGTEASAAAPSAAAGSSPAARGGCTSPPGADKGIAAKEIRVGFIIISVAGPTGNAAFGVPSPDEQQTNFRQVVDALNAQGGVACRKLTPVFFTANPADQTNLRQVCLDMIQAGVYAAVDQGSYYAFPAVANCYPQNKVPFFSQTPFPRAQLASTYPYVFGGVTMEVLYRNTAYALKTRGFFAQPGKLGFLYQDCLPDVVNDYKRLLGEVGVPNDQIVSYNLGCPGTFSSPSSLQQAILKFQQNGVTHLTEAQSLGDFRTFTTLAQQQRFHPKYGIPVENYPQIAGGGAQHPDYDNIDGAVGILYGRQGEESTPGFTPSAGTAKCDAIFKAKGRPPVYKQSGGFGGYACSLVWMVAGAINHAPSLQRTSLAAGLRAARSIDFSYPFGPNDFGGERVTTGGQFWRPIQFAKACSCWRVADPVFKPSFR